LGKRQLPWGAMKFPWRRSQVPFGEGHFAWGNNVLSLGKRLKFLEKKYILNVFAITTISCLFLYRLATYHWKGLEVGYNFVVGNTSIKIHMKKLWLNKISDTFVPQGTWLLPWAT
jgi:hypothetical protein